MPKSVLHQDVRVIKHESVLSKFLKNEDWETYYPYYKAGESYRNDLDDVRRLPTFHCEIPLKKEFPFYISTVQQFKGVVDNSRVHEEDNYQRHRESIVLIPLPDWSITARGKFPNHKRYDHYQEWS